METDHALFVDFGSTFTKIVLVDLATERCSAGFKLHPPWRPISLSA